MAKKIYIAVILILIGCLIFAGGFSYYILFTGDDTDNTEENDEPEIDDQISPYTNQGLIIEILRIRNRELLDKMLAFGTSWKNPPSFYYIVNVDGKEGNVKGNVGETGIYEMWDTMGLESSISFYIEEEQKESYVTISIMEEVSSGLMGLRTQDRVQQEIHVTYDYRTGRWQGDDYFKDKDGYGHYLGEKYEVWFNIYQSDFDHDGIPYWIEKNILNTDPTIDDRASDPDEDGIPSSWEYKWGYDPFLWDDHANLDPDIDGIENIEEYQMRKWLANPYQPDIFMETDGMQKRGILDFQHVFFEESQQMIIERFAQHGINVYIDDGWPDGPKNSGGEMVPFQKNLDDMIGKQMLSFYRHYFPDERKGIFRYVLIGNQHSGFSTPSEYTSFDAMHIGTGIKPTLIDKVGIIKLWFGPQRWLRLFTAQVVLHETGHTLGLIPITFPGNDILGPVGARYPNMDPYDYKKYLDEYHSIMNYKYIYNTKYFDYSDGSNGLPYDMNDWKHIYLPSFQIDTLMYEEPPDETFEDFEVIDEYPGVILEDWKYNENLTTKYQKEYKTLALVKNTDVDIQIFQWNNSDTQGKWNIKVFARPTVAPVHAVWSLITEGKLDSDGSIQLYSQQDLINEKYPLLA